MDFRQVGIIDAHGTTAQFTGANCVPAAGHASGADWAAQGNMLASEDAWHDMGAAFERTEGTLAQRLLAALDAAEATGGDWRGRGGAAIVIVPASGSPWERVIDLRVEEGDGSLGELRRLATRAEAYREANRVEEGRAEVARAGGLPTAHIRWLEFLDAATAGNTEEARRLLHELEREQPRWRDLVKAFARHPEMPPLEEILAE
jgi:uncharacterized Ntn-hydrolase superfamily protein